MYLLCICIILYYSPPAPPRVRRVGRGGPSSQKMRAREIQRPKRTLLVAIVSETNKIKCSFCARTAASVCLRRRRHGIHWNSKERVLDALEEREGAPPTPRFWRVPSVLDTSRRPARPMPGPAASSTWSLLCAITLVRSEAGCAMLSTMVVSSASTAFSGCSTLSLAC